MDYLHKVSITKGLDNVEELCECLKKNYQDVNSIDLSSIHDINLLILLYF